MRAYAEDALEVVDLGSRSPLYGAYTAMFKSPQSRSKVIEFMTGFLRFAEPVVTGVVYFTCVTSDWATSKEDWKTSAWNKCQDGHYTVFPAQKGSIRPVMVCPALLSLPVRRAEPNVCPDVSIHNRYKLPSYGQILSLTQSLKLLQDMLFHFTGNLQFDLPFLQSDRTFNRALCRDATESLQWYNNWWIMYNRLSAPHSIYDDLLTGTSDQEPLYKASGSLQGAM